MVLVGLRCRCVVSLAVVEVTVVEGAVALVVVDVLEVMVAVVVVPVALTEVTVAICDVALVGDCVALVVVGGAVVPVMPGGRHGERCAACAHRGDRCCLLSAMWPWGATAWHSLLWAVRWLKLVTVTRMEPSKKGCPAVSPLTYLIS